MARWKITWWYKDIVEGLRRGTDIITAEDLDEEDVKEMMGKEMWHTNRSHEERLPNFAKNQHSPRPCSWGVLKITKLVTIEEALHRAFLGELKTYYLKMLKEDPINAIWLTARHFKITENEVHERIEHEGVPIWWGTTEQLQAWMKKKGFKSTKEAIEYMRSIRKKR